MLIHTESEYQKNLKQVRAMEEGIEKRRQQVVAEGKLTAGSIKRLLDPMYSFLADMKDDLVWYENAKKGKFEPIVNQESLGRVLIALRIASGMTQEELARRMGLTQPQVSRDENNEYHGISLDRVQKILDVFGATLEGKLKFKPSEPEEHSSRGRKAA